MLSFFVLDEILNLIESVSVGFPSYSYKTCETNSLQVSITNGTDAQSDLSL